MARIVILPHSSVVDKKPDATKINAGELFVNSASGDGVSFLSTLKADGTIATFHEDQYWENKLETLSGGTGTSGSYVLSISDDGIVSCTKNGTDEGLSIDDNGIVSLA